MHVKLEEAITNSLDRQRGAQPDTALGAPISDPARFSMFPLPAGSETGAPGAVSGRARFQAEPAFSAPKPVLERTLSSANFASASGSRRKRVPTIAPRKPSGMLRMPGFSKGKS